MNLEEIGSLICHQLHERILMIFGVKEMGFGILIIVILRHLTNFVESLELDDEKESKIKEFCAKYNYARIPLDIDKGGYMRGFLILESTTYCIDEEELKKFGETLFVCIGNEDFYCAQIYLGGIVHTFG